jgi:hypothetical protein
LKERIEMDYWDIARPTYIENWPQAVCSQSIAQIDIPLTVEDAKRLGTNNGEFGPAFNETEEQKAHNAKAMEWTRQSMIARLTGEPEPPNKIEPIREEYHCDDIRDIRAKVSDAVSRMPAGAFIRLGSRSPKDSYEGYRDGFKILGGTDPLRYLLDSSERIYEDLMLAIRKNYSPHIFVRQWVDIPRWSEFRCFMHDRHLIGISQYNYLDGEVFSEITKDVDTLRWVIAKQFFPAFNHASHLDSVVFDVFVKVRATQDNSRIWEVKLLEINPFCDMTDPCLFAWNSDFNGDFRYNS